MIKKFGFTLAEVLITLTIIGVVAAVTIPTLFHKTGDQEYVTRLQKVYSVLSQATDEIITDNGPVKSWLSDVDSLYDLYKAHLRNSKSCGADVGCFNQGLYKRLNGKTYSWDFGNFAEHGSSARTLILSD